MTEEIIITEGIETPTKSDILLGRGAGVNRHIGNVNFRTLVKNKQEMYAAAATNVQKYMIIMDILQQIKSLNPPGRFITQDMKTGLWHDVSDEKARKKIGQALRENASNLRKKPVDKTRQSINYMNYTKEITYSDVKHAIENEIINKDSPLHQQLQLSYDQVHCHSSNSRNANSQQTISMELSSSDVDKFLNDYRSSGMKPLDSGASFIDFDTIGTFSIEDMSMSISTGQLEAIRISFRLDKVV